MKLSLLNETRVRCAVDIVSEQTGISVEAILGRGTTFSVKNARHRLMVMLFQGHGMSLAEVGAALGRDHTTVIAAVRRTLGDEAYQAELARRRVAA